MIEQILVIAVVLGAVVFTLRMLRRSLGNTTGGCGCGFQCSDTKQLPSCRGAVDPPQHSGIHAPGSDEP